jgi:hypothetical protein
MASHMYGINWALAWDESSGLTADLSRANNLCGLLYTSPSYRAQCQTLHIQLGCVLVRLTEGKYCFHTAMYCIIIARNGLHNPKTNPYMCSHKPLKYRCDAVKCGSCFLSTRLHVVTSQKIRVLLITVADVRT